MFVSAEESCPSRCSHFLSPPRPFFGTRALKNAKGKLPAGDLARAHCRALDDAIQPGAACKGGWALDSSRFVHWLEASPQSITSLVLSVVPVPFQNHPAIFNKQHKRNHITRVEGA